MNISIFCGLIILVVLIVLLLLGVPVAVALAVSSICAILPILNTGAAVLTGAQRIFSGISVFSLLAIPFFVLAGNIMNKGGIAIRLINFAKLFTGRIPGSLAHTNAVANMLFGSISGSGHRQSDHGYKKTLAAVPVRFKFCFGAGQTFFHPV